MQPEVAVAYASPKASLAGASAATRLRLSMQAGPICIMPRSLDAGIAEAIDRFDPMALPAFDVSGTLDRVRQDVEAAIGRDRSETAPVLAWLLRDISDLAALFAGATGAERLRVHLQVVTDDMCPRFHVDNVAFRLLTTYRGPGTEWMAPRTVAEAAMGEPLPLDAIRRMERGTVAIMRGGRHATADRPGVLHRSPPIAGRGTTRLFLAIDEAGSAVAP